MRNKSFSLWLLHYFSKVESLIKRLLAPFSIKSATKKKIDPLNIPEHIAVIMDGNGRWASRRKKPRIIGHSNALVALREVIEGCIEIDVPYLTLFAFSTENWGRPQAEVDHLMKLIAQFANQELETLVKNNVRLTCIGDLERLPKECQQAIQKVQKATEHCQGLHLSIALSYSGRWDILEATKNIIHDIQAGQLMLQNLDADLFSSYLSTRKLPDPALLIRTSGEMRISNFLLWQFAYTELFFTPVLWPDFRKRHLYEAVIAYQKRDRRFGKKLGL